MECGLVYLLLLKFKTMKNIITIYYRAFLSCETKTVEVAKPAGEWLIGSLKGDKFIQAQVAMDVIMGYAEKDFELMMERSADTVMFFPEKGGEIIQLVKPFDDFVKVTSRTLHSENTIQRVSYSSRKF